MGSREKAHTMGQGSVFLVAALFRGYTSAFTHATWRFILFCGAALSPRTAVDNGFYGACTFNRQG